MEIKGGGIEFVSELGAGVSGCVAENPGEDCDV